ncbi:hypothetical protein HDU98_010858 [Podochytrium sp. JEL0797]|nr:hypothetical protein HDU98_010858 [Podochytrium sp. JEL0797]
MAKVDCTDSGEWCSSIKVKGYPNIYVYHNGEYVDEYFGTHEPETIMTFIKEKMALYQSAPAAVDAKQQQPELKIQERENPPAVDPVAAPAAAAQPIAAPPVAQVAVPPSPSPVVIPPENPVIKKNDSGPQQQQQQPIAAKAAEPPTNDSSKPVNNDSKNPLPTVATPSTSPLPESADDEPAHIPIKGVARHPRKEFNGFRGFLQSRLVTPLVGPECSTSLLTFQWFSHFDCTRLLISKVLGIGLVAGGAVIKIPQIIKIFRKRSAVGVSFASYALETAAYIAGLAYNVRRGNPFNTYGEHAFMAVANCIVIAMMFHYTSRHKDLLIVSASTFIFTVSLFSKTIINDTLLLSFQWLSILIGIVSKLPQIYSNWSNKSCGQLSAVTVALQTVGSLARCFTTATEVKDLVIFVTYLVATGLNGAVLWQVILYWGKKRKAKSLLD